MICFRSLAQAYGVLWRDDIALALPRRPLRRETGRRAALMTALACLQSVWLAVDPVLVFLAPVFPGGAVSALDAVASMPAPAYWFVVSLISSPDAMAMLALAWWIQRDFGRAWRNGVLDQTLATLASPAGILSFFTGRWLRPYLFFLLVKTAATTLLVSHCVAHLFEPRMFGVARAFLLDMVLHELLWGLICGFLFVHLAVTLSVRTRWLSGGLAMALIAMLALVPSIQVSPPAVAPQDLAVWEIVFFWTVTGETRSSTVACLGMIAGAAILTSVAVAARRSALRSLNRGER